MVSVIGKWMTNFANIVVCGHHMIACSQNASYFWQKKEFLAFSYETILSCVKAKKLFESNVVTIIAINHFP
jgi:hypothetical protein